MDGLFILVSHKIIKFKKCPIYIKSVGNISYDFFVPRLIVFDQYILPS